MLDLACLDAESVRLPACCKLISLLGFCRLGSSPDDLDDSPLITVVAMMCASALSHPAKGLPGCPGRVEMRSHSFNCKRSARRGTCVCSLHETLKAAD